MENIMNYDLEAFRGAIKQIMKVRRLRSINFANYFNEYGTEIKKPLIHSVKIDVMTGYIDLFEPGKTGKRCGKKIQDATVEQYGLAYRYAMDILTNENTLPYKAKRGILVGVYR